MSCITEVLNAADMALKNRTCVWEECRDCSGSSSRELLFPPPATEHVR